MCNIYRVGGYTRDEICDLKSVVDETKESNNSKRKLPFFIHMTSWTYTSMCCSGSEPGVDIDWSTIHYTALLTGKKCRSTRDSIILAIVCRKFSELFVKHVSEFHSDANSTK